MSRREAMFNRAYGLNGRRGEAVRAMSCVLAGRLGHKCSGAIQAAHAIARGRGGVKGDARVLFPACAEAHREFGEHGTSQRREAVKRYGVDPVLVAEAIARDLDERFGPEPCHLCGAVGGHEPLCRAAPGLGRIVVRRG